jgi:hypothetical protein
MQVKLKRSIGVQYTAEATKDGMIYLPCLVRKLFSAEALTVSYFYYPFLTMAVEIVVELIILTV